MNNCIDTAVIFAAGMGMRMRPLSLTMPKPLMPLLNNRMIDVTVEQLRAAKIRRIFVNVHYMADVVRSYLAQRYGDLITVVEEKELLDTGGALVNMRAQIERECILTCNSDTIWVDEELGAQARSLCNYWNAWTEADKTALLLVSGKDKFFGVDTPCDFHMQDGQLFNSDQNNLYYLGLQVINYARMLDGPYSGKFSLSQVYRYRTQPTGQVGGMQGVMFSGRMALHVGDMCTLEKARYYGAAHALKHW